MCVLFNAVIIEHLAFSFCVFLLKGAVLLREDDYEDSGILLFFSLKVAENRLVSSVLQLYQQNSQQYQ